MKKMKKNRFRLSIENDLPVLKYIWRWKVMSTMGIHLRFKEKRLLHSTYKQLARLRKYGYLQSVQTGREMGVLWGLTKAGFQVVKTELPELKGEMFKTATAYHDYICFVTQVGDWAKKTPKSVNYFSERQLCAYYEDHYPEWVPKTDIHRPDGYTKLKLSNKSVILAIEVELNIKSKSRYVEVGNFYQAWSQIDHVIWIVPKEQNSRVLDEILNQGNPSSGSKHLFFLKDELLSSGWGCKCILGKYLGLTLQEILGEKPGSKKGETKESCTSITILNTQLDPIKSGAYSSQLKA